MRPHLPTRVPSVIDGLIALIGVHATFDGVQVVDGPVRSMGELEDDSVVIAPATPDNPGTTVAYEAEPGLGRKAYVEIVEVSVVLTSFSGEENMKARRDRVTVLLGGLQDVLTQNQVREDAWDSIAMGPEAAWHQVQSEDGATCALGLTVVTRSVI